MGYESLAEDGALVLGERLRDPAERARVVGVLQKVMRAKVSKAATHGQRLGNGCC